MPGQEETEKLLENWQGEFEEFLGQTWEDRQIRKRTVATAINFLSRNGDQPLVKRVEFLKFKGLQDDEIEDAFEAVGAHNELLRILEKKFTPEDHGPTPEERAAQTNAERHKNPFVVGQRVLAYTSLNDYYPAVVTQIDEERHEDVLDIEWYHNVYNEKSEQRMWAAPGFKGVVADIIPKAETVNVDGQVLVCVPKQNEDCFHDALVLETYDDDTFDVEFNDCTTQKAIPLEQIRTLTHPKQLALQPVEDSDRRLQEETIRKARVGSSPSFPTIGNKERPVRTQEIMALMTGTADARNVDLLVKQEEQSEISQEEREQLGTFIRSFIRYPRLDIDESPPLCRRFNDFVSVFGDVVARTSMKVMPKGSVSQLEHQEFGKGYGFDFSGLKTHPTCPYLYEFNPVLEVAHQCLQLNQMFIDPDFPPSFVSLHGKKRYDELVDPRLEALKDQDKVKEEERHQRELDHQLDDMEGQFEWRRVTEILHHPRATITGSNPYKMTTGAFTNSWLCCVFGMIPQSQEFDEMFSPAEESSLYGAYSVRVFVDGRWYFVLVDDFIPVYKKGCRPACIMSVNPNELWPMLLEKVYAKLEGSFRLIKKGRKNFVPERVFEDLTGGCAVRDEYTLLDNQYKNGWFENMMGRHEDRSFCTQLSSALTTATFTTERKLNRLGIELGTYHYVRDVYEEKRDQHEEGEQHKLVHIVNPWANLAISEEAQERMLVNIPDKVVEELKNCRDTEDEKRPKGLWMPLNEYMRRFESSLTCYNFNNWQRACLRCSFSGCSGGSKWAHDNKKWTTNPQFYINVLNYGQLAIQARLLDRRYHHKLINGNMLSMSLYRGEGFESVISSTDSLVVSSNTIDFQDGYANVFPSVYLQLTVNAGGYVLIPEIGAFDSDEDVVLKVWATSIFQVRWMNDPSHAQPTPKLLTQ